MARKKAAAATAGTREAAPPPLGKILVVEDDAILAMSIEAALVDAGAAAVHVCSTTSDALAALREHKPDGMVLDVHLADRDDGWAIAELVSEVGPNPPRIVFSTGAPRDIPAQIAELGPVLEKPYSFAELVALLRKPPREGLLSRLRGALNP
ncbi:MAG: response regulator [Tsuneonella sp.]